MDEENGRHGMQTKCTLVVAGLTMTQTTRELILPVRPQDTAMALRRIRIITLPKTNELAEQKLWWRMI